MKRVIDKHYGTYSIYTLSKSGIYVKCPECGKMGIVTVNDRKASFICTNCSKVIKKELIVYRYDVHNKCKNCGKYYRIDITEKKKQHFPALHVACPSCGCLMSGKVHKTAKALYGNVREINHGFEPVFGFELWFLTYLDDKPIWALNHEHLVYLINYLSATLREKPVATFQIMRTQADHLPTFMKTAKNRDRIIKLLKQIQQK